MSRSTELEAIDFIAVFNDPQVAAQYAEGPRRFVPGYEALHRMTAILLAENTSADARVLVIGAGGGLELRALAKAHPAWSFVGVDPAREMLRQVERELGPLMDRVTLVEGERCLRDTFCPAARRRFTEWVGAPSHVDVRAYDYVGAGPAPGGVYRGWPETDVVGG